MLHPSVSARAVLPLLCTYICTDITNIVIISWGIPQVWMQKTLIIPHIATKVKFLVIWNIPQQNVAVGNG